MATIAHSWGLVGGDIIATLGEDHCSVLNAFDEAYGSDYDVRFWAACLELTRHELAKELCVYSSVQTCGYAGDVAIMEARVQRGWLLSRLGALCEGLGGELPDAELDGLVGDIKTHFAFEDYRVVPILAMLVDEAERLVLFERYECANVVFAASGTRSSVTEDPQIAFYRLRSVLGGLLESDAAGWGLVGPFEDESSVIARVWDL